MTCPIDPYQMGPAPTDHIAYPDFRVYSYEFPLPLSLWPSGKTSAPVLIKTDKKLYDAMIKKIKSDKKQKHGDPNYNVYGSLLCRALQNIENDLLTCITDKLKLDGLVVGALCFDGCLIEKDELLTSQYLDSLTEHTSNITGYNIKLAFKSTETEWVPIPSEPN